jgi:phosphonate transport system ATP-binding protein
VIDAVDAPGEPLLALHAVRVEHQGGVVALDAVDLVVRRGERVAIVGPSGAGKSTLLGLCNATVSPTSGHVVFRGESVADSSAWRRRHGSSVALIPQQLHLAGRLRVVHNVNAGRLGTWSAWKSVRSLVRPVEVDEVRAVLARVGIADRVHERTERLSGGEQQRVALARALRQEPLLMLADEPTASLDPANARSVMDLLGRIATEQGIALIVSQHDVELALDTCDRVIGLRRGQVVFDEPTRDIDRARVRTLYDFAAAVS